MRRGNGFSILLVEDDNAIAHAVTDSMGRHGMSVCRAGTVHEATERMSDDIDVVVLDLGLPDGSGFEVLSQLRRAHDVPIIITTARGDLKARVHGLDLGADDYLVKPFEMQELLARLHAVCRRAGSRTPKPQLAEPIRRGRLTVDSERHEVHLDELPIELTRKEFAILALLAEHPGVVIRREQLLSAVWESSWRGGQHTLNVHMAALRSKLGDPAAIETVRGIGYRLGLS